MKRHFDILDGLDDAVTLLVLRIHMKKEFLANPTKNMLYQNNIDADFPHKAIYWSCINHRLKSMFDKMSITFTQ
jgi:hypothetical protein